MLQREYELWTEELNEVIAEREAMSVDELAKMFAHSLEKRVRLLKLMSMNHFDMEAHSRLDRLTEFKTAYGNSMKSVSRCLEKFCPSMTEIDRQNFIYSFFPFIYGIYPYTFVTDKQRKAMKDADVNYVYMSIYEMTYTCVRKLLGEHN